MQKFKILDLFSGLGGFSLGLERTGRYKTVAFCEIDKYCTLLLQKHWKGVKIYNDVKKITKEGFEADGIESPDIITGGFPCQPFSVAGKQKGTDDDRHLWPEMFRIIKAFKPRFVIGENVPGIVNIQDGVVFETVCTDLESQGYEVQPFNIPAAAVGAPHQRKRIWIIATLANSVSNDERREISRSYEEKGRVQEEYRSKDNTSGIFSGTSEIRKGNNRYENVANTKNGRGQPSQSERWEGTKRGSIDSRGIEGERKNFSGTENVENPRRTLRQGSKFFDTNEDEVGKENANQYQRSSSPSESNVANATESRSSSKSIRDIGSMEEKGSREEEARNQSSICTSTRSTKELADTKSISSDGREYREHQEKRSGQRKIRRESSEELANTDSERLEGLRQSRSQFNETSSSTSRSEEQQGQVDQGWWSVEPNVGRVAHGVPGRVHRLKALGNSIVPQIAEEIGRALIKAADDS